ncbi:MAG: cation transporting ATPase C-terminal domain-containing protein [Saprospiraceae bacterium]|nr:cation transporting ATPase C-terminal domain-containing protein [Saprospiraceae bacterium]
MVLTVYYLSLHEGHNEGEVRAIAFSALIVGNIFLILTSLSKTRNIISVLSEKNISVLVIIGIALTLLFLTISVPALQNIFSFHFPGFNHFITSLTGAFIILVLFESYKFYKTKNAW